MKSSFFSEWADRYVNGLEKKADLKIRQMKAIDELVNAIEAIGHPTAQPQVSIQETGEQDGLEAQVEVLSRPKIKIRKRKHKSGVDKYRQKIVGIIKGLRESGMTFRGIADRLNDEKFQTLTGKGVWSAGKIHFILRSESDRESESAGKI